MAANNATNVNRTVEQQPSTSFASNAWTATNAAGTIPVVYISMPFNSWRLTSFLIISWQFLAATTPIATYDFTIPLVIGLSWGWLIARGLSKLLHKWGWGDGEFGKSAITTLGLKIENLILRIVSSIHRRTGSKAIWFVFWHLYFIFAFQRQKMMQNYLAAWERKYPDCFLVLFVDHTSHLTVPVASAGNLTDDHDMVIHLDHFYRMIKIQGGIFQALLPKLLQGTFPSKHMSTMELGYVEHRQIRYFHEPELLVGQNSISNKLRDRKVIQFKGAVAAEPGAGNGPKALSFISGWDPYATSFIILAPTVISIVLCITWPAVAVIKYHADVQVSVQTGVILAMYMVTAGALLIALVTWYDTLTSVKLSDATSKEQVE